MVILTQWLCLRKDTFMLGERLLSVNWASKISEICLRIPTESHINLSQSKSTNLLTKKLLTFHAVSCILWLSQSQELYILSEETPADNLANIKRLWTTQNHGKTCNSQRWLRARWASFLVQRVKTHLKTLQRTTGATPQLKIKNLKMGRKRTRKTRTMVLTLLTIHRGLLELWLIVKSSKSVQVVYTTSV